MKYKVIANKEQLSDIGIGEDIIGLSGITGMTGELIKTFPDNWIYLRFKRVLNGVEFTNDFGIPLDYLVEVETK